MPCKLMSNVGSNNDRVSPPATTRNIIARNFMPYHIPIDVLGLDKSKFVAMSCLDNS